MKKNTDQKQPMINNVKNRLLFLSPTVKAGLERESNKDDFEALDDKALGKGGFGHVWKVRHKVSKKIYAIKVINKDYIRKENMIEQINRETEIMYRTDHPHIIKLYNHYEDDENFYLIMHCASKGQLYSHLKKVQRFDERNAAQYMREIISAVHYLHSLDPPIIHRDIKPENILIDGDGRAKLADFGWSNFHDENKIRETYCGTPEYLAPEMVTKSGHNEGIDIWALGVLMFELLAGRPPFVFKGDTNMLYNDIKNLKIRWTDDFPILAKNLVSRILKVKSNERITLDEMLTHPWFKETPIIRPVLEPANYDPAMKLQSHLLHVVPDESKLNEIKALVGQRKKEESRKNIPVVIQTSSMSPEEAELLDKEINRNREEIKFLKEELTKKDKLIEEYKEKMNKSANDDVGTKVRVQERGSFLQEIEVKTKKLLETESELSLLKNEFSRLEMQFSKLKDQYDEQSLKYCQLEHNLNESSIKLTKLEQEKQQEVMNLEMKLRIAEVNFVQDSDAKDKDAYDPDRILKLTNENLADLVVLVRNKFSAVERQILDNEKSEIEFRSNLISQIDRKVNDMVNNFKDTHERILNEEKNIFKKQLDDAANRNVTYSKSLDWYKNQINELFPYKQKFNQNENLLLKLQADVARMEHACQVLEEKNKYLSDYISMQGEKMNDMRRSKEIFKNSFYESEKLFNTYVKNKPLRDLINFKENFVDPA